jgi:hypothetical protein
VLLCFAVVCFAGSPQAGFGSNATGTGDCLLCPLGSFWPGPNSNPYGGGYGSNSPESPTDRYYSDRYDNPDTQDDEDDDRDSQDDSFLSARIQQTTPVRVLSAPAGVRPCINCSEILPLGSSATTLELGADGAAACVCSPGAWSLAAVPRLA